MGGMETRILAQGFGRLTSWAGRSGRLYDLVSESLDRFAMGEGEIYVIAKGRNVLWVGSTAELVADPLSRSRFRLALDCAERVYRLSPRHAEAGRLSAIWDLEGAEPMAEAQAA